MPPHDELQATFPWKTLWKTTRTPVPLPLTFEGRMLGEALGAAHSLRWVLMDWLQPTRWATKYPTHKGPALGLGKDLQDAPRGLRLNTRPCRALFPVKKVLLLDKGRSQKGDEAMAVGVP